MLLSPVSAAPLSLDTFRLPVKRNNLPRGASRPLPMTLGVFPASDRCNARGRPAGSLSSSPATTLSSVGERGGGGSGESDGPQAACFTG